MHATRVVKFPSLPAALGLGTALILACSDGGPTAPGDQVSAAQTAVPFAAPTKENPTDDTIVDLVPTCAKGFTLQSVQSGTGVDFNNDGFVCAKGGTGPKKH